MLDIIANSYELLPDRAKYAIIQIMNYKYLTHNESILKAINTHRNEKDILKLATKLSKEFNKEEASFIVEQISTRQKALNKFIDPSSLFFKKEALEQASSQSLAQYHASFFPGNTVLEICTGIGSDLAAISHKAKKVYAIEKDKVRCHYAECNMNIIGENDRIVYYNNAIENISIPKDVDAVFTDPSRRLDKRKLIDPEDYSPKFSYLLNLAQELNIKNGKFIAKLSPLTDCKQLSKLGTVEYVSHKGELKELLFILDRKKTGVIKAVILNDDGTAKDTLTGNNKKYPTKVSEPLQYIIEPNVAVIKAKLTKQLSSTLDASLLNPTIDYLTSSQHTQTHAANFYEVIASTSLRKKDVRKMLRDNKIEKVSIKKRGLQESAEQIAKLLEIKSGSNKYYLFTYPQGKSKRAILAQKNGT